MKFKTQCAIIIAGLLLVCGCSGNKKAESQPDAIDDTHSMIVSATDTNELRAMAIDYLSLARDGRFDECLSMLHQYDETTDKISELSPENRARILNILQTFPIINFSIDEINFDSEISTQIFYTIEMFPNDDSGVPNTMKFSLSPKRLDWKWYLCIDPINEKQDK